MTYEMLEQEIKALPEDYITELGLFITYLKLKAHFADFANHNTDYEAALNNWRLGSQELFNNADDAAFMQTVFDTPRSTEKYAAKEIW